MGKLRGFVPASQLSREHQGSDSSNRRSVGRGWWDPGPRQDHRAQPQAEAPDLFRARGGTPGARIAKSRLLDELREGEVRSGTVSSISDFGAFVNLGGADGLVHLSELSWN